MRALVTGGTGFLGSSLVQRLLSDGHSVRVLTRSSAGARHASSQGADPVVGDITDRHAVTGALQHAEIVYHLAGRLFGPEVPIAEYRRTHVEGTAVLLECCRGQRSLTRFVHVSTTGVLGVTGDRPAVETAPYAPTNAYELTKCEAEQLVQEFVRTGFPAAIVRPALVYGPGDLHLVSFFRAIQRGRFRPIGRKHVYLHPIYVDDLTEGLLRCGHDPRAIGECFHLAGCEPVTLSALASTIANALGVTPLRGTIPLAIAQALALLGDLLPPRVRPFAPLTSSRLDFLTHSRAYNVEKARDVLGYSATTDLTEGVARTVAWYRAQAYLPPARTADSAPLARAIPGHR